MPREDARGGGLSDRKRRAQLPLSDDAHDQHLLSVPLGLDIEMGKPGYFDPPPRPRPHRILFFTLLEWARWIASNKATWPTAGAT